MVEHRHENHVLVVRDDTRPPGRTKVTELADCPVCLRPLKVGGWGYPHIETGDLRLHHKRCLEPGGITRREIAVGRTRPSGLPRGVTRASRSSSCPVCPHAIRPGHLIELHDGRRHRHVLCPGRCVRCEMPITGGQRFASALPKPGQQHFGYKHERCDYEDLQAKRQRDADANAERQRRLAERRRSDATGRGVRPADTVVVPPQPLPRHRDTRGGTTPM